MSRKLPVLSLIIYYNIPVLSNLTTIWTNYDNYNDRQYFFFFFFQICLTFTEISYAVSILTTKTLEKSMGNIFPLKA